MTSVRSLASALRIEHAHLPEEHDSDRAALHQRSEELVDVQAREMDARATADALLQATRAAEERATRAERTAALAQREVGFLQAINVRLFLDRLVSLYPPGRLIRLSRIGELRRA